MTTWNYRILHKVYKEEDEYGIHEVYYDEDGVPKTTTVNSVGPYGNTYEEFIEDMAHYVSALSKPVLEYENISGRRGDIEAFLNRE